MERYDVVIVGAGPAGSTCARLLSENGLSVLLMDRDTFPREKPCAGWITPAVLKTLKIDPQEYRKERLLQNIREFRTGVMYGPELVTNYGRTVSYGIRRSEFDHFLLLRCNCRTRLAEPVTHLERVGDGWVVNGTVKTSLLIGAGGHRCPVSRALGAVPGKEPAIVAMVAEFEMGERQMRGCGLPAGSVGLYFTGDLEGYGWIFRKGSYLNVGLGSMGEGNIRRQTVEFCSHLRKRGDLPEGVHEHLKGHAYLPYRKTGGRRIVDQRTLLIGDAAGLSAPESGEGILPAIESAVLAAEAVVSAAGDYSEESLQPYATSIAARFGGSGGSIPVPLALKQKAGEAILSSHWLTRHLVLDRWFLHRDRRVLDPDNCGLAFNPVPAYADMWIPLP